MFVYLLNGESCILYILLFEILFNLGFICPVTVADSVVFLQIMKSRKCVQHDNSGMHRSLLRLVILNTQHAYCFNRLFS